MYHSNRYYSSLLDSTKPTLVFGPLFKCEFNDSSNKVKSRLKSQINWKLSIENQNSKSLWLRVLCSVHSVRKLDFWSKNWIFGFHGKKVKLNFPGKNYDFNWKITCKNLPKISIFMIFSFDLLKSGSWQMKLLWKWGHFHDLFFDQFFPPIITLNIDSWTLLLTHGFPFQTHNSSPTNSFMVVYYISQTWKLGNPKAFFYPSQILQSC